MKEKNRGLALLGLFSLMAVLFSAVSANAQMSGYQQGYPGGGGGEVIVRGNNCASGLCYGWANDLNALRQNGIPSVVPYSFTRDAPAGLDGGWLDPHPVSANPRYVPARQPRGGPQGWPTPPPRLQWGGGHHSRW